MQEVLYLVKGEHKKAPGDLTSRGRCPSFDDNSTFLQITREREWENRRKKSWTPAMVRSATGKKKTGGNAAINKGTNASKVLASQRHHPLQSTSRAVGIVYELPKTVGAPSAPLRSKHRCFSEETPVLRRVEGHVSADGRLMQPWSSTLADSSKLEH